MVRAKMARLSRDRVARILDDLFVTRLVKQSEKGHNSRILRTQGEEPYDLRVTEEDLRIAMKRYDPKKAAGVEGVPGQIVKIVAEQRFERLLDLFNCIYRVGGIPAVWKLVRVVLLPEPARDPLLSSSSSYRHTTSHE